MKGAGGQLVWSQDEHRSLNTLHPFDLLPVQRATITDNADDGDLLALGEMHIAAQVLHPGYDSFELLNGSAGFHDYDHDCFPSPTVSDVGDRQVRFDLV